MAILSAAASRKDIAFVTFPRTFSAARLWRDSRNSRKPRTVFRPPAPGARRPDPGCPELRLRRQLHDLSNLPIDIHEPERLLAPAAALARHANHHRNPLDPLLRAAVIADAAET